MELKLEATGVVYVESTGKVTSVKFDAKLMEGEEEKVSFSRQVRVKDECTFDGFTKAKMQEVVDALPEKRKERLKARLESRAERQDKKAERKLASVKTRAKVAKVTGVPVK